MTVAAWRFVGVKIGETANDAEPSSTPAPRGRPELLFGVKAMRSREADRIAWRPYFA
jgi:hypothetical protein